MVINSTALLAAAPIVDMVRTKIKENGVSFGLSEAGYDIRIKQTIIFKPPCDSPNPDYPLGDDWTTASKYMTEDGIQMGFFNKGKFVLASAIEEFDMPNHLMGIVHDKSTWARKGLSVFNTVIEPGWKGFLTLELVYHGQNELIIPAGSGIAQVVFHQVAVPTAYKGKYQNQENKPVEARES